MAKTTAEQPTLEERGEPEAETIEDALRRVSAERDAFRLVSDAQASALDVVRRSIPDRRSLDERMAAVQGELEDVPRRGHAEVKKNGETIYTYDYITEADLMAGIRPLLAKHGIATYYRDEIIGQGNGSATVRVWITFAGGGDERTISGDGVGTDYGDKAASKAKTTAVRYLLWKTFLQPSDDDPEQENVDAADAARRAEQRGRSTSTSRASRPKIVERIGHLALELDEVQGHQPGATLGRIPGLAKEAFELIEPYPNGASDQELVAVGQQLAEFLAAERARKESAPDAYMPAELEIRGPQPS